jgi:hypothetical protein
MLSAWRKATARVIAARKAVDIAEPGTPAREAAEFEYEAALAEYRTIGGSLHVT